MDRKNFMKLAGYSAAVAASGGLVGWSESSIPPQLREDNSRKGVYVPEGKNRFEEELMIWGVIPLQIKVSGKDTNGAFFAFEHARMGKGGPPRHFHYEQDEWFYAIEGEFAFEVGEEKFVLRPGDSLFAPRMVPHVWAYVGDKPGTLLAAIQPVGSFEEFFMKCCDMTQPPTPKEAEKLFAAYGMKVVGPPLSLS